MGDIVESHPLETWFTQTRKVEHKRRLERDAARRPDGGYCRRRNVPVCSFYDADTARTLSEINKQLSQQTYDVRNLSTV